VCIENGIQKVEAAQYIVVSAARTYHQLSVGSARSVRSKKGGTEKSCKHRKEQASELHQSCIHGGGGHR